MFNIDDILIILVGEPADIGKTIIVKRFDTDKVFPNLGWGWIECDLDGEHRMIDSRNVKII